MRSGRVTIHDIAAIAGVSAGTVSRVINEREGVGSETRERIRRIVREHGFTASAAAQRLSTGRSSSIGIVSPMQASQFAIHPIYPMLLGALGDAAADAGYDILLLSIPSAKEVDRLADAVNRRRVDGVVLPAAGPNDPIIKELSRLAFPTVIIGHREKGAIPWVDSTHDAATRDLTRLLIGSGRRRLLMLNGPNETSAFSLRSKGFWSAVEESGDQVDCADEQCVGLEPDIVKGNVSHLFAQRKRAMPSGIVAGNDTIAATCLEFARQFGIDVPGRLAVTGFDDLWLSEYTAPPLTTARMPLRQLGFAAIEMLISLIEGKPLRRKHLILPTELVIRSSTPLAPAETSAQSKA